MAGALPVEILDRIFAELSPFSEGWRYVPALSHTTSLARASLVCATWRTAAQKRLFCQVSLKTTEDLQWLGLKKSEDILSSCKILVLCLYDSTISPKRRIDSHALSVFLPLFKTVQQLFIETHKREDDPDLANFIRECTMVQVLLVWHALADEEYDSESEGSQSSCWSAIDEYVTSSIATFPSLMSEALPSLTSLRHFAAIRIDLRASRDAVNPHQPGLANLALLQSYLSTTVLKHLMHDRRCLRNLAIVQPDEIKGEELIKALSRPFPILRELAITFPWRDYTYPPEQAGAGAKLAGVVAQVLPSCKSIKKLHCQDHDFQLDAVLDLPNLEELIVTVDRPETFNAYMEHEVRRSEISFLVDVRGPQVANCLAVKQLMKDWGPRGVKIGIAWPVGVHTRPLTAFAARLPDPVIGVSRHELLRTALRLYKDLRAPLKHQQVLV